MNIRLADYISEVSVPVSDHASPTRAEDGECNEAVQEDQAAPSDN
jgi:hypothetical protein